MSRPRRIGMFLVPGLIVMIALASPVAAGGRPETFMDAPIPPSEFAAGELCEFALEWDTPVVRARGILFPVDEHGDQVLRFAGFYAHVLTNLDTGDSIRLKAATRTDYTFHADGSADIVVNGSLVVGLGAADLGGPGFFRFRGHVEDRVDDTFTLVEHSFSGGIREDLCAALAG